MFNHILAAIGGALIYEAYEKLTRKEEIKEKELDTPKEEVTIQPTLSEPTKGDNDGNDQETSESGSTSSGDSSSSESGT